MTGPANGGRFPAPATWEPNQEIPVGGTVGIRPKSLRRLFEQGKFWRTRDGEWVRVKDMHPAHRANAARMLLRKASEYAQAVSMADLHTLTAAPDEVVDDAFREDMERTADPEKWIRSTKLYRRLVKGLPVRHAEGVPVHPAGKCQVCDERRETGEIPAEPAPKAAAGACPHGYVGRCTKCADRHGVLRALRRVHALAYEDAPDLLSIVEQVAREMGVKL